MNLKDYIAVVEGFPKEGISFKDVSPLLADKDAFKYTVKELAKAAKKYEPDVIIGPESRGFLFGTPVAYELNKGFVMARKEGKLPEKVLQIKFDIEYGQEVLCIPYDAIKKGMRVLIVDDLIATGGTIEALAKMCRDIGAIPVGALAVIELTDIVNNEEKTIPYESLIKYNF